MQLGCAVPRRRVSSAVLRALAQILLAAIVGAAEILDRQSTMRAREQEKLLQQNMELHRAGRDMECAYPNKHSWWKGLANNEIDIVTKENPGAVIRAVVDCLQVSLPGGVANGQTEHSSRALAAAVAILQQWVRMRDEAATAFNGQEVALCSNGFAQEKCDHCAEGYHSPHCLKLALHTHSEGPMATPGRLAQENAAGISTAACNAVLRGTAASTMLRQLQFGDSVGDETNSIQACDPSLTRFMLVTPSPASKGMASCVSEIASCMHYTASNNRTMVVDGPFVQYKSLIQDVLQPLSGCTREDVLARAKTRGWRIVVHADVVHNRVTVADFEAANVIDMGYAPSCKGVSKYPRRMEGGPSGFKVPESLNMGWRSFRGEIYYHLLRPRPDLQGALATVNRLTRGNTVGIHIRHGRDKEMQRGVSAISPVADYLDRAIKLAQGFGRQPRVTFVVATDVSTVVQSCRDYVREQQDLNPDGNFRRVTIATQADIVQEVDLTRYDDSTFAKTSREGAKAGLRADFTTPDLRGRASFRAVLLDVLLLGNCDYLVGTCTSYVGTMAAHLRLARELDHANPVPKPKHRAVQMDSVQMCKGHPDWHDLDLWAQGVDLSAPEELAQIALTRGHNNI